MCTSASAEPRTGQAITTPPGAHATVELREEPALGNLAMSIVHDLRNPLAAIHSGAELLNGPTLPEQDVRRLARNMYNASLRIQEMLQDYVDLFRTSEGRRRPARIHCLVSRAVERIAGIAKAQSVMVVQDVPADLVLTVERRRIESVLGNLVANAVEAMPHGGSVHVSAVQVERSVVIRVLDTGPGIAPEIRERLFQPFVTARKANGWGLGLTNARQAVIEHGGEIWLESPSGRGACFAFRLPMQ
jgi:signal transduction histidine kinase